MYRGLDVSGPLNLGVSGPGFLVLDMKGKREVSILMPLVLTPPPPLLLLLPPGLDLLGVLVGSDGDDGVAAKRSRGANGGIQDSTIPAEAMGSATTT